MKLPSSLFFGLLLAAQSACAFTQSELNTLKTAVQAEPSIADCVSTGNDICVADWLNSKSTFIVWRTSVSKNEYQTSTGPTTGTTFDWSGTGGYIARSAGERDAWNSMFSATGSVNPSRANVIAAFNDIFSGTGAGAVANRALLLDLSKRAATFAEKILATGAGTQANPGKLVFEGSISFNTVAEILRP